MGKLHVERLEEGRVEVEEVEELLGEVKVILRSAPVDGGLASLADGRLEVEAFQQCLGLVCVVRLEPALAARRARGRLGFGEPHALPLS